MVCGVRPGMMHASVHTCVWSMELNRRQQGLLWAAWFTDICDVWCIKSFGGRSKTYGIFSSKYNKNNIQEKNVTCPELCCPFAPTSELTSPCSFQQGSFHIPSTPAVGGKLHSFSSCLVNDLKASDSKYLDKSWCSAFHPALLAQTEALLH